MGSSAALSAENVNDHTDAWKGRIPWSPWDRTGINLILIPTKWPTTEILVKLMDKEIIFQNGKNINNPLGHTFRTKAVNRMQPPEIPQDNTNPKFEFRTTKQTNPWQMRNPKSSAHVIKRENTVRWNQQNWTRSRIQSSSSSRKRTLLTSQKKTTAPGSSRMRDRWGSNKTAISRNYAAKPRERNRNSRREQGM